MSEYKREGWIIAVAKSPMNSGEFNNLFEGKYRCKRETVKYMPDLKRDDLEISDFLIQGEGLARIRRECYLDSIGEEKVIDEIHVLCVSFIEYNFWKGIENDVGTATRIKNSGEGEIIKDLMDFYEELGWKTAFYELESLKGEDMELVNVIKPLRKEVS